MKLIGDRGFVKDEAACSARRIRHRRRRTPALRNPPSELTVIAPAPAPCGVVRGDGAGRSALGERSRATEPESGRDPRIRAIAGDEPRRAVGSGTDDRSPAPDFTLRRQGAGMVGARSRGRSTSRARVAFASSLASKGRPKSLPRKQTMCRHTQRRRLWHRARQLPSPSSTMASRATRSSMSVRPAASEGRCQRPRRNHPMAKAAPQTLETG